MLVAASVAKVLGKVGVKQQSHYSGVRWDFGLRWGDFGSKSL